MTEEREVLLKLPEILHKPLTAGESQDTLVLIEQEHQTTLLTQGKYSQLILRLFSFFL